MAQKVLLGIDIGTQGTKGAFFDVGGRCLAETFHSSRLHQPSPEVVEEDPEIQLDPVCSVIRDCMAKSAIDPSTLESRE